METFPRNDHLVTDAIRPFDEGEVVLAYFDQSLYQAKVLRAESGVNAYRFLIHYLGWSKRWDEWVSIDRLLKNTEENREKLQDSRKKLKMEKEAKTESILPQSSSIDRLIKNTEENRDKLQDSRKKKKMEKEEKTESTLPQSSNGAKGNDKKAASAQKDKATSSSEKHLTFPIPPSLRTQLIDDQECVAKLNKLVKLPRSPNVDEIFNKYEEYRQKKKKSRLAGSVEEFIKGLRLYFDKALPAMLLYNNERQQFEGAVTNSGAPSVVYGAEHLLRLFVKLPEMLHNAGIEEKLLEQFEQNAVAFLKFLQKNQSSFFLAAEQSSEQADSRENKSSDSLNAITEDVEY